MTKETVFRAKCIKKGEWHIGHYYLDDIGEIKHMIKTPLEYAVEIDPDTLCEYTGINDNDGSRIFQNDIIRKSRVRWNPMGYWDLTDDQHKGLHEYNHAKFYIGGNIFDDPEMLKYKL